MQVFPKVVGFLILIKSTGILHKILPHKSMRCSSQSSGWRNLKDLCGSYKRWIKVKLHRSTFSLEQKGGEPCQVANYLERKTEPRSCGVKRKVDVVGLSCTFPNPLVPDVKSFRRRSKLAAASVAVLVRCDVYLIQERKEKIRRKTDLLRQSGHQGNEIRAACFYTLDGWVYIFLIVGE